MRRLGLGVLFAAMIVSGQTAAERQLREIVDVQNGFITGVQYRNLSEVQRSIYVMGWFDGLQISAFFGAPSVNQPGSMLGLLTRCTKGMTNVQLEAIFSKWLGEQPIVRWYDSAHALMFSAMADECHLP